ncbi:hypothetical protein ACFL20_02380, partial [Spirochaetota bacterium]
MTQVRNSYDKKGILYLYVNPEKVINAVSYDVRYSISYDYEVRECHPDTAGERTICNDHWEHNIIYGNIKNQPLTTGSLLTLLSNRVIGTSYSSYIGSCDIWKYYGVWVNANITYYNIYGDSVTVEFNDYAGH